MFLMTLYILQLKKMTLSDSLNFVTTQKYKTKHADMFE